MFNQNNLKKLIKKNHLNILFYNCDSYDNIIDFFKINKNINETKIEENNIIYFKNLNYYIFDALNIKNIYNFKQIINNITKNIYTNCKNYIIIKNLDCNKKLQAILFSIIERNHNIDYTFIFLIKSYNKIINKIKNICINIRCNNKYEIHNNLNLNLISKNYLNHIFENRLNFKKIKEISYILSCLNISFNVIIKNLLYNILDIFEITNYKKYKIIHFLSELEYRYIYSYNKLIYYEYLFLNIYKILFLL